jgi:hypothetical protein
MAPALVVMNDTLYMVIPEPGTGTFRATMANAFSTAPSQPLPPPPPPWTPPPPGPGAMS